MTAGSAARGRNAILVPAHVTPADLPAFLGSTRLIRNLDGLIVTIPHKFTCVPFCTSHNERSAFLGAVNIIRREGEGWHGDMLDGLGFVAAIRAKGGEPRGARALLVGAGGAGWAIALALVDAGVASLAIHDTDIARRDALIKKLRTRMPVTVGSADPTGYDLVANASSAGMKAGDPHPVDVARLSAGTFAACAITSPDPAPWIAAAIAKGCRTSNGVDMYRAAEAAMLDFLLAAGEAA